MLIFGTFNVKIGDCCFSYFVKLNSMFCWWHVLCVQLIAVTPRHLKYISLVVLALQNAALIIVMRYVRTRPGDMFASTTAVVMTEVLKVTACFIIIWFEEGMSVRGCCTHLNENIIQQPWDCVRVSVPAFIYMIQNNLIYVAASNLDVATFQVKTDFKKTSTKYALDSCI